MPWIVCTLGDDRGLVEEIVDGQTLILGRQEGCEVRLRHQSASRRHCQVTLTGDALRVQDLGSSNGIKQKGRAVRSGSLKLKPEETFDIGGDRFMFISSYEQYVEVVDGMKGDRTLKNTEDLKANYSQLINEVTRTQRIKQPKPSFFQRFFGKDK